ncbi:MAG: DUF2490 domain-containing protein [Bacteroidota bacterium]
MRPIPRAIFIKAFWAAKPLVFGFFCTLMLVSESGWAQGRKLTHANQQWLQVYHAFRVNSKWTLLLDEGFRWRSGFSQYSQYVVRPAVGYTFLPNWQLRLGWAHLGFFTDQRLEKIEFRPYLEVAGKQAVGESVIKHRFRLEHRRFHPAAEMEWGNPELHYLRWRYGLIWQLPLFDWMLNEKARPFLLGIGDELLLNTGQSNQGIRFDQNRLMISPTLKISAALSLSLTWNGLLTQDDSPGHFIMTHIAWMQVRHAFLRD